MVEDGELDSFGSRQGLMVGSCGFVNTIKNLPIKENEISRLAV
jgi:hypothetical protein